MTNKQEDKQTDRQTEMEPRHLGEGSKRDREGGRGRKKELQSS